MKTITEYGQNIIDLAIQTYGNLSYVFAMIQENGLGGLNVNLAHGIEINYNAIAEDTPDRAVQSFYEKREIRVKTGEEKYYAITPCGIPEGYVLWQFRIDEIATDTILYLNSAGSCPSLATVNSWDVEYKLSHFALIVMTQAMSPTAAAYNFATWFNEYREGFAFAADNAVTLLLPKSEYPCDTDLSLCAYKKARGLDEPYSALETPPDIYYPSVKTRCCNNESGTESENTVYPIL